jgi:hypothetical protein
MNCKFWNSVGGILTIPWAAKRAGECRKSFESCHEFSLSAPLAASYWLLAHPFNYQDSAHRVPKFTAKEDLGGYLTSAPAAVVWTSTLNGTTTVISVFGRNARNSISYRSFYRGTWTPWIDLGGVNFSSGPAITSDGPNDIEMVARGSDNQIYMKNFSNSMWGNWFSLGGVNFTSAPAIASYGHGYWEVYARGGDYALWKKSHYNDTNWWSPWLSLGGVLTSAPAAVSWGSRVNEVFVRNTNNTLSHISDANYYTPHWVTEDREIPENLAAASWESGGLDLFVRSDNGMLVHKSYTGTFGSPLKTVSDWTPLPAFSVENFAAAGW